MSRAQRIGSFLVGVVVLVGLPLALGMMIGRATQPDDPGRVYGWAMMSAVFGASVGLAEILTRYRDEPVVASLTPFGLAYLGLNAIISLAAFALLRSYPTAIFAVLKDDLFLTSIIAGFGAMTVFRSKLFTYKSADGKEYAIGPAIVLETVLKTIDQKIDRQRATYRQARVFGGTKALHDFEGTAQYIEATLGSFQNVTQEQKTQIGGVISDFRKAPYPDRLKLMGIGFAFLDLAGEENFDLVISNIQAFLESLPICCVHAVNITANSADIVWITTAAGDSQVEYGTSIRYGTLTPMPRTPPPPALIHQQTLSNLNAGVGVSLSGEEHGR